VRALTSCLDLDRRGAEVVAGAAEFMYGGDVDDSKARRAVSELVEWVEPQIAAAQRSWPHSPLGHLGASPAGPDVRRGVDLFLQFLTAGLDNSAKAIAFCLHMLSGAGPATLPRLSPSQDARFIEEVLRVGCPARHFMRSVVEPIEIDHVRLQARTWVYLSFSAANRDPTVYVNPHEFSLSRRDQPPHLAFGTGAHRCPGAGLARLALREVLTTLRAQRLHVVRRGPISWSRSDFSNGIESKDLELVPEHEDSRDIP
jgi:cytochrome P450